MRIAVTGYRGKLGSELIRQGCVPLECDVTLPNSVEAALDMARPDAIIHCAAVGNQKVDWCESELGQKESYRVNVRGTATVRDFFHGPMILVSTSYIFDGKRGPYAEKVRGVPEPVNFYGFTKLAAECVWEPPGSIVRTVGLYGGDGPDFAKTVIGSLSAGDDIQALTNLSFNPTYVPHLASALIRLSQMKNPPPVVNVAGIDILSRYDFALLVAEVFGLDEELVIPTNRIEGWVAPRPLRAGLKVGLAKKIGLPIYGIMEGLCAMKDVIYARA